MWPTKMKFDWPYSEIGRKMANGRLLFCALYYIGGLPSHCPGMGKSLATHCHTIYQHPEQLMHNAHKKLCKSKLLYHTVR